MRALLPVHVLLVALVVPDSLVGQTVVPDAGEEIRVVRRGEPGAIYGIFVEATSAAIVLDPDTVAGAIAIPRGTITGMSVQRGHRSQALKGTLIGLGVGIAGGVILGQGSDAFDGTAAAVGVSVGAALPVGLLIGWLVRSPEWDGIDMGALAPTRPPLRRGRSR